MDKHIPMPEDPDEDAMMLEVEVAYGTATKQRIIPLRVAEGTTAYQAVLQSGIAEEFDGIDPDRDPMGIFSKVLDGKSRPTPQEYVLRSRDRVEIYRHLLIDPKQARLQRAVKAKANTSDGGKNP